MFLYVSDAIIVAFVVVIGFEYESVNHMLHVKQR